MKSQYIYKDYGHDLPYQAGLSVTRELQSVKRRVEKLRTNSSIVIPVITDVHSAILPKYLKYMKKTGFDHIQNFVNLCSMIDYDFAVNLGDVNDGSSLSKKDFYNGMQQYVDIVSNLTNPIVTLRGNHDDNSLADKYGNNDLSLTATFEEVKKYFYHDSLLKDALTYDKGNKENTNGYLDIKGVRFIFLDSFDTKQSLNSAGKIKYPLIDNQGSFRQSQIDWLVEVLNNTSKDTKVAFFSHTGLPNAHPEKIGQAVNDVVNGQAISTIIKAFQEGSPFNYSDPTSIFPVAISGAFSDKHTVLGYFHGHMHWDGVGRIPNSNIPILSLLCSKTDENNSFALRRYGTKYEDSFNVLVFDNNIVNVVRYGAGLDQRIGGIQ